MKMLAKLAGAAALVVAATSAQAVIPVYPTPGTANPALYTFTASMTGDITAYFAGSTAGYNETLGLLVNGVSTGITGLQNHTTPLGTALDFGSVTAGDSLIFFINVQTTGDTFYSRKSLNGDGFNHVWSTAYAGGDAGIPAGTLVAFEDLRGGGDRNYNDEKFVFTNTSSSTPEPAAWALMLGGFGLIGAALRRRTTDVVAA